MTQRFELKSEIPEELENRGQWVLMGIDYCPPSFIL
jgi:hypothetical protein